MSGLGWMPSFIRLLWANQHTPFLKCEFSVSPSDLADGLIDCKLTEQDNVPNSLGLHTAIVFYKYQ